MKRPAIDDLALTHPPGACMTSVDTAGFQQRATELRAAVDGALDRYTTPADGWPEPLRAAIRHSLLAPGKRLRPLLVLLATEACGGLPEHAMPAACAVEMVHAYSLIHDDLPAMDDDDLRRGRPTCHKVFGEATAILAGDALLALAFQVLAEGIEPPAVAARCCAALARAAGPRYLVGGQADDMASLPPEAGMEVLESIHARKTGAMMEVSLRLGAMAAGASPDEESRLQEYGRRIGLAFQITDDLLDIRGDEAAMGKRVGKDRDRGKLTFPGLLGVAASRERAEALVGEAVALLAPFGPHRRHLEGLACLVLERNH